MIEEAIEKARAYSDNKGKIDAYYDGYVACYLELNKKLKAEHTRGEIDFVNLHCNSTCKKVKELEAQIEKMKCLNEEIIKALNECLDYEWLHAHNGQAKYMYLQTVIDIVNEKFKEIKEND